MSDIKCGRCADLKACRDHPEALVGSRWRAGRRENMRVVGVVFHPRLGRWCAVAEADGHTGVYSMYQIGRWARLPEAPAPMPTTDDEMWVNVYPDGRLGTIRPTRAEAVAVAGNDSVGTVRLVPDPESWQPAEQSKP